jgi:hypothetical protein
VYQHTLLLDYTGVIETTTTTTTTTATAAAATTTTTSTTITTNSANKNNNNNNNNNNHHHHHHHHHLFGRPGMSVMNKIDGAGRPKRFYHSPSSAEVKNCGFKLPLPFASSWRGA